MRDIGGAVPRSQRQGDAIGPDRRIAAAGGYQQFAQHPLGLAVADNDPSV